MKTMTVASLAFLLIGCAPPVKKTQRPRPQLPPPQLTQADPAYITASLDRVKQLLKDPNAAEFSNIYAPVFYPDQKEDPSVCGTVNAKNSYGGYAGNMRFVVTPQYPNGVGPFVFWEDQNSFCAQSAL